MKAGDTFSLFFPVPDWDPGAVPTKLKNGRMSKPRPAGYLTEGQRKFVWLNANHRPPHWATEAAVKRAWRHLGRIVAETQAVMPAISRAHIVAEFVRPSDARRWDPANLGPVSKAILDGLVDAGLFDDDDHHHIVGPDPRGRVDKKRPGVWFHITVLEP